MHATPVVDLHVLCTCVGDYAPDLTWLGVVVTAQEASLAEDGCHELCAALRPDVIALTDAFDFPDRVGCVHSSHK